MSNVISEYMGDERKAIIRKAKEGFEVDLYLDQLLSKHVKSTIILSLMQKM